MRIALTGSHRTGKSTLLAALAASLPGYDVVDEPYHLLEEEGYAFSHPPSLEDFEAQLERSLEELAQAGDDVLFDRCPADFLAYLSVHEDADQLDLDAWLPKVQAALESLDALVLLPIEDSDRIPLLADEDEGDRRADVDEALKDLLLGNELDLAVEVLEVEGDLDRRAGMVLRWLRRSLRT